MCAVLGIGLILVFAAPLALATPGGPTTAAARAVAASSGPVQHAAAPAALRQLPDEPGLSLPTNSIGPTLRPIAIAAVTSSSLIPVGSPDLPSQRGPPPSNVR